MQDEKSSGTVFSDSEMYQALGEWQKWVARPAEKDAKNIREVEKDTQAEKIKQAQQIVLLRMLKERFFQQGLATLPAFGDSGQGSSGVQTREPVSRIQTKKKQKLEAKLDEKINIRGRETAVDGMLIEQGDTMLGVVKELMQIMKEDSVAARSDTAIGPGTLSRSPVAGGLCDEQKERVEKLEAKIRNLAMEVQELKEVVESTSADVAMVLQLLQRCGMVGSGVGGLPKSEPTGW